MSLNPALMRLADRIARTVSQFGEQPVEFSTSGVIIGCDVWNMKLGPAPFTIERRVDTPFSANKYFSSAPLPTEDHIAFLKQFEAEVLRAG